MSREFSMNNPENKTLAEIRAEAWQQGRADYAKEISANFEEMDRTAYRMGRADGIMQGRADKYQEITSEYMLLTEKQVAEIRAEAIDECIKMVTDEKLCLELEKMKEQCSTYTATVDGVKREFM